MFVQVVVKFFHFSRHQRCKIIQLHLIVISNISVLTTFISTGADPGFDQGGAPDRDRPKTAILGPQFCRILVLGPHFWWSGGGPGPRAPPPLDPPLKHCMQKVKNKT